MGSFDISFDSFASWHGCDTPLVKALQQKNYPAIYAALRKLDGPLREDAFPAFYCALFCTFRVFQAVMEHCSPKSLCSQLFDTSFFSQLITPKLPFPENTWWSAVDLAAYLDKPEALDLLLKAGCSPNRAPRCSYSPLEAAVLGRSLKCTQRLLEEPGLDTTVTKHLLDLWSQTEQGDTLLDWCCQLLCGPLLGNAYSPFEPAPLPSTLTVVHTAQVENWPLTIRLCREWPVEPRNGTEAMTYILAFYIGCMNNDALTEDLLSILCQVTDALLQACPALLRREIPRRLLAHLVLAHPEGVPPVLAPWLENMPGSLLIMDPREDQAFLTACKKGRWAERFGTRLYPALKRSCNFPNPEWFDCGTLSQHLTCCKIYGKPPKGALSALAQSALTELSAQELAQQLLPGKLLDGEDPVLLLQALEENKAVLDKRAAVLALYTQKEEADPYDL